MTASGISFCSNKRAVSSGRSMPSGSSVCLAPEATTGPVIRLPIDDRNAHAACRGIILLHLGSIDPGVDQVLQQLATEPVVADPRGHRSPSAVQGGGGGLVAAFAAADEADGPRPSPSRRWPAGAERQRQCRNAATRRPVSNRQPLPPPISARCTMARLAGASCAGISLRRVPDRAPDHGQSAEAFPWSRC